ncbi:hypothetical protein HY605_03695 [Candidatus Peregrinibacteria bacterium]|nr:hypothetical protein [Candidatus Peregrinibacteria bacterium]
MSILSPNLSGEQNGRGLLDSGMSRLAMLSMLLVTAISAGCREKVEATTSVSAQAAYVGYGEAPRLPNPVLSEPVLPEKREAYDFAAYEPPRDFGLRIPVAKEFVPGRKTVVYIVDKHPDPKFSNAAQLEEGKRVQRQLFFILKDILDKTGSLPMVVENWPYELEGMSFEELGTLTTEGMSPEEQGALIKIFQTPDLQEKMRLASENVGKDMVVGGMYMMAASPRVKALGSVSAADIRAVMMRTDELTNAQYALEHPEQLLCGPNSKLNFGQAWKGFERGVRSPELVDCYCALRMQINGVVADFSRDRFVDAPRKEVARALRYEGDFAVVVAGLNHLKEAMRQIESGEINVVLLAPKDMGSEFPAALREEPKLSYVGPLDDKKGTCAKNEPRLRELARKAEEDAVEAQRAARDKALIDWISEDEDEEMLRQ